MAGTPACVHVIGGGLAGSEAAWQLAQAGVAVILHEMRPERGTAAHHTEHLAELVCSNSFRSDDAAGSAIGLLHAEMRRMGSLILASADGARVPAGSALAVDRDGFARKVEATLLAHPLVTLARGEVTESPPADWDNIIIATGPLTSTAMADAIRELTGADALAFFDAIAPIVYKDSIDFSVAWLQSRYDKEDATGDRAAYINCPLDGAQYDAFIAELVAAETTEFKDWERSTPYFEGCLPIEVMAARGPRTLSFGPMKPVGLTNPHSEHKPRAVVQLRQDNALGTLYNMVGFQTKMTHGDQTRVFRTIPGLEGARFARLGGIHRNTFIDSPRLLDGALRLNADPRLRFAGQITGVEGYVESAAIGLLAGRFAAAERTGLAPSLPPPETALGALLAHITGGHVSNERAEHSFQPMNVNFGLFPPTDELNERGRPLKGRARREAMSRRALGALEDWLKTAPAPTNAGQ